jgi:hypothetical protein
MITDELCAGQLSLVRTAMRGINAEAALDAALAQLSGWVDGDPDADTTRCILFAGSDPMEFRFRIEGKNAAGQYTFVTMGRLVFEPDDNGPRWVIQAPGFETST